MRKLSPEYDNFYKKLLQANEDFCKSYPDVLKENKNKKMDQSEQSIFRLFIEFKIYLHKFSAKFLHSSKALSSG